VARKLLGLAGKRIANRGAQAAPIACGRNAPWVRASRFFCFMNAQENVRFSPPFQDTWLTFFNVALVLVGTILFGLSIALGISPSFRLSVLVLLIASGGFLLVEGRGSRDLLHPVRVLGALWCFCLALGSMRLLPIISAWGFVTWSCFLTGLVCFMGGFWLASRFSRRREDSRRPGREEEAPATSLLVGRKTLIVAALSIAVGVAVLGYEYHLTGTIPILADNPDEARSRLFGFAGIVDPEFDKLYIKLLHPFVDFIKYGVFLAVIVLCQRTLKSRKAMSLTVVLIVFGTLMLSSQGGRNFFVSIAITSIVLFHYLRRRVRLVEFVLACSVLFLILGLFGSMRTKASGSAPFLKKAMSRSSLPEGEIWNGIAFAYATVTVSFEVFHRLTDDLRTTQRPSGGFLFYSFHRFLLRSNLQLFDKELYTAEMITPTYLGELYGDYGYWGVLFGSLALGLGYGYAYMRGEAQKQIYWIYVRALLIQMLIYFPYFNEFSYHLTWIWDLFFMYLLLRYLTANGKKQLSTPARPGLRACLQA
jgi:oligosaccharide repeat unit polymerase